MANIAETFEFVKEHPKVIAGSVAAVAALAVTADMAGDYDDQVIDPLRDKYTCVVDYMEVTNQQPGSEVVVDVAAQPVPGEDAVHDCEEPLEELLEHDYAGQEQDDSTIATVDGRPQLIETTTSDLTWTEIEAEVADRLEKAREEKAGHVASKLGGGVLKVAILGAAVGGTVIGVKAGAKNVKNSIKLSRSPRVRDVLESQRQEEEPAPVRPARSAPAIEDTKDLSDVELPPESSSESSDEPALADVVEGYKAVLTGRDPVARPSVEQLKTNDAAWQAKLARDHEKELADDAARPNLSLEIAEPDGPAAAVAALWRKRRARNKS